MSPRRIAVTVEPGLFASERTVSFEAGKRRYSLLVDAEAVRDGFLAVGVVGAAGGEALIELPGPTFTTGGRRVWVPRSLLVPV